MSTELVVKKGVKDSTGGFDVSEEFYPALDKLAEELIQEAKRKASENSRDKLEKYDLDCQVRATGETDLIKKTGVCSKAEDLHVSKEFYSTVNNRLKREIVRAKERASANSRRTLKPQDI